MFAVRRLNSFGPFFTSKLRLSAAADASPVNVIPVTRVERSINYVETDKDMHYDDMVTVKFDKIDRKVVPKQHLEQAKTFVFAPTFEQFLQLPSTIAQSSAEKVLETFCVQPAEDNVSWSRSLMGQRFGYKLKENSVFPHWFPFFVINVQQKAVNMPLARIQLVRMSREGPPKYEYASPSIYYYDQQDWTCSLKKPTRKHYCMAHQHNVSPDRCNEGLFAAPCGDLIACKEHADKYEVDEMIGDWIASSNLPIVGFERLGNFICSACHRLATPLYEGNLGDYTFRSLSSKRSQNMLAAIFTEWMRWLKKSNGAAV